MRTGFQFDVLHRDNDLVKLRISASNGDFAGTADIYLGTGQLGEIAKKLQGFPRSASDVCVVILGTFDPEAAGGGVNMRFYCADRSGHIYVETRVESERDSARRVQSALLLVPTEPGAIDAFVDELHTLDTGAAATACLRATAVSRV